MTPVEIGLLLAIAALIYQEVSWRDKARRIEADYEKRIAAEVAMVFAGETGDDEGRVRSFTFRAEKQEPVGLFRETTRHLFLSITVDGENVRYAAGDLDEMDRFQIPPRIKWALLRYMATPAEADAAAAMAR